MKCLQRGTDWVFKLSSLPFVFKGLIYTYTACLVYYTEVTASQIFTSNSELKLLLALLVRENFFR